MDHGRKRKQDKSKHKKEIRKELRESGQPYMSANGKPVKAREITDKSCGCSKHCNSLIPWERRLEIFCNFYKLEWSLKNAFLDGFLSIISSTETLQQRSHRNRMKKSQHSCLQGVLTCSLRISTHFEIHTIQFNYFFNMLVKILILYCSENYYTII